MDPLVSILIPAYNTERWIADTLGSAVRQTWARREIIVVDDGSSDRTLEIARSFSSPKVLVVSQENQGASAARNHALSLCQGDYIQWLDADDLLSPDKIQRQIACCFECENPGILFSGEWGYFACQPHKATFKPTPLWNDLSPVEWLIRKMRYNLHMQTATWLVSRELTQVAKPWDVRLVNDNDGEYFCRVILASSGIRFVPDAKVYYRIGPSRRLSVIGKSDKKKNTRFLSMKLHVQYLRSLEDSERVREACITYLQNWLINFYPERPDILRELDALAQSLGGRFATPELRWKYRWMIPFFGWSAAKSVQMEMPELKARASIALDYAMCQIEAQAQKITSDDIFPGKERPPTFAGRYHRNI
jgi:glycosyltransferase involved in cell wall biosynthesis